MDGSDIKGHDDTMNDEYYRVICEFSIHICDVTLT